MLHVLSVTSLTVREGKTVASCLRAGKFYSEEDTDTAVNRLSVGEAGTYSKERNKKKVIGKSLY